MIDSRQITNILCRLAPFFCILFVTVSCAASISGQLPCTRKLAELPAAPELFGFRLGMTRDDVKSQVPRIVFGRNDEFGVSKTTINPDFDPLIDKTRFQGVRTISLDFLDERLTSLWIGYDNTFRALTIDDFVQMISTSLRLPNNWSSWKSKGKQISCADFQMTLTTVAGAPSFRILDLTAADTVTARRYAKEQQDEAAEAGTGGTAGTKEASSDVTGDKQTRVYYPTACQPAKEINETDRVVFKSAQEAEKAGFKMARSCH